MYGNIKRLREAQGLSQQQLADMTNIAQAQISKYEKGRIAQPSFASLSAIAHALGVHVEELTDNNPGSGKLSSQQFETWRGKTERYQLREINSGKDMIPFLSDEVEMSNLHGTLYKDDSTVTSYMRKPVMVDGDWPMYSMKQYGDEMEPRIKKGETIVAIDDGRYSKGSAISLVITDKKYGKVAMLRVLKDYDDEHVVVDTFKGSKEERYSREEVHGIHRVFGAIFNM